MARGQSASTGRSARSERVSADQLGQALGRDGLEQYLIKNATRGYPANSEDLRAQYGEEAYESRANGLRAPNYDQWLQQQVNRRERTKARENSRERLLATPEGKKIESEFVRAKKFYNEASAETYKAREELEVAFQKEYGQPMADYMDKASERGRSADDIDASIKVIVPEAYAKVDRLLATEQALRAEYEKKEKARQAFFNP